MHKESQFISNRGKLVITNILENADETRILAFFRKLYKNASDDKLIELIRSLPATLSSKMPLATAQKLIGSLEKIGVTAHFIPLEDNARSIEEKKAEVSSTNAQPSIVEKDVQNEILDLFQTDNKRFSSSLLYKTSLLCVAIAMIVLPFIYIAMIFGVLYLICWHMMANFTIFSSARNIKGALILYLLPLFVGFILISFLIKPFFARKYSDSPPYRLDPSKDPLLFEVVKRIARALKAPVPVEIYADTNVNASASFKNGLFDLFRTNLTLTIGIPLANGMNISQFSGIIAHELGHFSQSFGMRLSYLIRMVNNWFARVVYERDAWDKRIHEWTETLTYGSRLLLKISQGFIWLSRKLLWVLMRLGHFISCHMSQQMEFDADRYEVSLVGSDTYESTVKRLVLLSQARRWAMTALEEAHEAGKLVDNFPGLIVALANQTDPEIRQKIEKQAIEDVETDAWNTHPAYKDRIAAARRLNLPSTLKTDNLIKTKAIAKGFIGHPTLKTHYNNVPPASFLIRDFNQLACDASYEFYGGIFGEEIADKKFETVDHFTKRQDAEIECNRAFDTFLKGQFSAFRPLALNNQMLTPPQDVDACFQKIKIRMKKMETTSQEYNGLIKRFIALRKRFIELSRAALMVENEQTIVPKDFNLPAADMSTIDNARLIAKQTFEVLTKELKGIEKNTSPLVHESIKLLFDGSIEKLIKNVHQTRKAVQKFVLAAVCIENHYATFYELENCAGQLNTIGYAYSNMANKDVRLLSLLNQRKARILGMLEEIKPTLDKAVYPFTHQLHNLSLGDYLIDAELSEEHKPYDVMNIAYYTLNRVYNTYTRIIGRMIYIAETVVNIAGGDNLPTPFEFPLEIITTGVEEQAADKSEADADSSKKRYKSYLKESLENTRKALSPVPRSFSVINKIYNRIRPPSWMKKNSPLQCIYKDQNLLLTQGRIVWGQVIQANTLLFEDRSEDCPAAILFTMDPSIDEDPEKLQDIAKTLYSLKDGESDNEELNKVVQVITDEYTTWMNHHVSAAATGTIDVFYSTIMVHRKHLPLNYLKSGWFPLLIHPTKTKCAMILPSKYWDPRMAEIWCRN
jgi:Zn-dependent protease with chaperone function